MFHSYNDDVRTTISNHNYNDDIKSAFSIAFTMKKKKDLTMDFTIL